MSESTNAESTTTPRAPLPGVVVFALAVMVGIVAWAAFLSYRVGADYSVWQVLGAAAIVLLGSVCTRVVARARHAWATVVGVTMGLAGPWAWDAGAQDTTGLFLVGLILLVVGLLLSTVVITILTDVLLRRGALSAS